LTYYNTTIISFIYFTNNRDTKTNNRDTKTNNRDTKTNNWLSLATMVMGFMKALQLLTTVTT